MNRLEQLRQALRFYDQQGLGGGTNAEISGGGMVPIHDPNRGARRMMFAERMAGIGPYGQQQGGTGDFPDFFADDEPAPRNGLAAFVRPGMGGAGAMPARASMPDLDVPPETIHRSTPMRGRVNNALANLMRMR